MAAASSQQTTSSVPENRKAVLLLANGFPSLSLTPYFSSLISPASAACPSCTVTPSLAAFLKGGLASMTTLYTPGLASDISNAPLTISALSVSVEDSAHARTAPSAGDTVPLMDPDFNVLNANNPAATAVTAASLNLVNFINRELKD